MRSQSENRQKQKLGGKEFPAHQLKTSSHFTFRGALALLFVVPVTISIFQTNDSSSVKGRPGFIFLSVVLAAWTCGFFINSVKYRSLVRSKYEKSQLFLEGSPRVRWANRARWMLAWASALSWAVMWLDGHRNRSNPDTVIVAPWALLTFYLAGIVAVGLTAILHESASRLESGAFRIEEARGLKEEIRAHEVTLKDKTDSIVDSLSERISKRIADLERISSEIGSAEYNREQIQRVVDSETQAVIRKLYDSSSRRDFRRQWGFLALSFLLGFVVNWLSAPSWDLLHRIHF